MDFDTIRDFRRLPVDLDSSFSPALTYIIRQVQNRQEWMRETLYTEKSNLYSTTIDLSDKFKAILIEEAAPYVKQVDEAGKIT